MADDSGDIGPKTVPDEELLAQIKERESKVSSLISSNTKEALIASLQNPPVATKNQEIKDANAKIVFKVLAAIKEMEIKGAVAALSPDDSDVLMKYVYKGLETQPKMSPSLLKWHAAITAKDGLGTITRALVERQTV